MTLNNKLVSFGIVMTPCAKNFYKKISQHLAYYRTFFANLIDLLIQKISQKKKIDINGYIGIAKKKKYLFFHCWSLIYFKKCLKSKMAECDLFG